MKCGGRKKNGVDEAPWTLWEPKQTQTDMAELQPSRQEKSLGLLTSKFVSLLQEAEDGVLDIKSVSESGNEINKFRNGREIRTYETAFVSCLSPLHTVSKFYSKP